MNKFFILSIASLALVSCDQQEKRTTITGPTGANQTIPVNRNSEVNRANDLNRDAPLNGRMNSNVDADNTGRNIRDRDQAAKLPENQSESDADRGITQRIRQALVDDSTLSTNGKNIKVITINGVVTLRGPVASTMEKQDIERKVKAVSGVVVLDSQLEITR